MTPIYTSTISLPNLLSIYLWLYVVAAAAIIVSLTTSLIKLYRRRGEDRVVFQLTPPRRVDSSLVSTAGLFELLHGAKLGRLGLEIVASEKDGIRFLVVCSVPDSAYVRQTLQSYLPDMLIEAVSDPLVNIKNRGTSQLMSFRCISHKLGELKPLKKPNEHDPLHYITHAMSNLNKGELIALQLVICPSDSYVVNRRLNEQSRAAGHILRHGLWRALAWPGRRLYSFLPTTTNNQPWFDTTIRLYVKSGNAERRSEKQRLLTNSLKQQGLVEVRTPTILSELTALSLSSRLPTLGLFRPNRFSAAEIAGLYHFPDTSLVPAEQLAHLNASELPMPTSLSRTPAEVVLGTNSYHNRRSAVGLSATARARHSYIVGGTGSGKTTLMLSMVLQDIKAGRGMMVIDPHGDLVTELIGRIPKKRIKDVIYFDPDDSQHLMPLNLLELTPGLKANPKRREADMVVEAVVSVMRKLFGSEDVSAHRIEYIMRCATRTALTVPGATLATVYDLLTDPLMRQSVVNKLEDGRLKHFWFSEFNRAGDFARVKMSQGVTAKLDRFLSLLITQSVTEQARSTFRLEKIMDQRKILIANLSYGLLGEDASQLFGITLLTKLQLAALARARQPHQDRIPYYLDEFQNYATPAFAQLISEARKFGVYLTLAEQSTALHKDRLLSEQLLANVGSLICFRTASPQDDALLGSLLGTSKSSSTLSEQANYHFYLRTLGTNAPAVTTAVSGPLKGEPSSAVAAKVIAETRRVYSHKPATNRSKPQFKERSRLAPVTVPLRV